MAVNVRIKQKSLFKKKLDKESIVKMTNLAYGYCDENYRLVRNEFAECTLLYEEEKLARGIELSLEEKDILLRLNLPTSLREIKKFYEVIEIICHEVKASTYIREEEEVQLADNYRFTFDDAQVSVRALEDLKKKITGGDYGRFEIFGVCNPISIGLKEIEKIDGDLNRFEEFLHHLQAMDVYYATPRVYKINEKLIGVYAIGVEIPSVLPTEPYIVFDQIKDIAEWFVMIGNGKTVKYDDFINHIKKKDYYDANHVVVTMMEKEKEYLVKNLSVEI